MKLRNKKTGEIIIPTDYTFSTYDDGIRYGHHIYYSLAELNEEWEDYKPKEPLIENKEIREIIRAWAKVNDVMVLKYNYDENSLDDIYRNTITFNRRLCIEDGHSYTITELCGE